MLAFLYIASYILTDDTSKTPTFNAYIDLRERYESHQNPTFSGLDDKNLDNLYSRLRIGVAYDSHAKLSGAAEYQNSNNLFWNQNGNGTIQSSDASLAYLKYSTGNITAIGGRQRIDLGQQRLIGETDWLNLGRSFDAGRIQSGQWDAWAGGVGVANNEPLTARIEDLTHTDKCWGTTSFIEKHDLGPVATIDIQTLDHFVTHSFGKTVLDAEGAVQYGSSNGRDQRAWAWHVGVKEPILPKTTLGIEGNAASGGGNATTSRTFDNLYPSNHDLYGLADLVGWKNMNELAVKLENHPMKSLTLRAEAHSFSLRDNSDGWYNALGSVNVGSGGPLKDPTGASGGDLGQEYDLLATYSWKHVGSFMAGIAFFEPGHFVANLGNSSQLTYGFLQYRLQF